MSLAAGLTLDDTAWVRFDGEVGVERISLRYDPADPLAVAIVFRSHMDGDDPLTWTFGRDLLSDGLDAPAGLGDVRVSTVADTVHVIFSSDEGSMLVELRRAWVVLFLRRAYRMVARGAEIADEALDAAIALLREDA